MKRHHQLHDGRRVHLHGWKPDRPDHRDARYAIPMPSLEAAARLPRQFLDMRGPWAEALGIYDQGEIGSCTANGVVQAFRWLYWKAKRAAPDFSRLAQYAWCRDLEGVPLSEDSGCSIRDAIRTVHLVGACPENLWAYDPSLFDLEPPKGCREAAEKHQALSFHSVPGLAAMKFENSSWYPVAFGFSVYPGAMSEAAARTGEIPIPEHGEEPEGGHCMVAIGYCDDRQAVLCANSWGKGWGDGGFAWLPYWYWQHGQADDLWVVHTAEQVALP